MLLNVGLSLEPKFEMFLIVKAPAVLSNLIFPWLSALSDKSVIDFITDVPFDLKSLPKTIPLALIFPCAVMCP